MNLLDSFYFLFKTNAKQAQKEVEDFGKSTQDVQDKLNRADNSANKLGLSFQRLALAGVQALGEFAALGKLKDGIKNAIDYNAEIEKTSRLTNINARQLSIWNDVVARAGGNPGGREYLAFITNLNKQYAGLGINDRIKRVNQDLINISGRFAELEKNAPGSSQALASKLGIGPDLWLALKEGPEILQRNIDAMQKFDNTTEKTAKDSLELKQSWVDLGFQFRAIATDLIPLARVLTGIVDVMMTGFRVMAGLSSGIINTLSGGKLGSWQDIDRQLVNAFPGLFDSEYAKKYGGAPSAEGGTLPGPRGIRNNNPGNLRSAPGASTVNGFARFNTLDQGIAAEQRQLGIYGRRGWNTLNEIGSHWAPSNENDTRAYVAALVRATGFGPNQQLDLSNPAVTSKVANAINRQENGAAYGSLINGQGLLAQADRAGVAAGGASNQKTVTIGNITINTQATDARGIAGDLHSELQSTVGAFDDGVKF